VNRHLGYAKQPQNWLPSFEPLVAVRKTISHSHFGQNLRVEQQIEHFGIGLGIR
jgi:hypothetical protein